jgi:antitoxin HigA-1
MLILSTTTEGKLVSMPMKNPPHPGLHVRLDCLEPLGLSVTKGAKALGVTRQALNNLVNGRSGVSPEMAVRLSKAFGGHAAVWLRMQMEYDLAQVEKSAAKIKVRRVLQAS